MTSCSAEQGRPVRAGGKSETGGNASWPQRGWTPLPPSDVSVPSKFSVAPAFDINELYTRYARLSRLACRPIIGCTRTRTKGVFRGGITLRVQTPNEFFTVKQPKL